MQVAGAVGKDAVTHNVGDVAPAVRHGRASRASGEGERAEGRSEDGRGEGREALKFGALQEGLALCQASNKEPACASKVLPHAVSSRHTPGTRICIMQMTWDTACGDVTVRAANRHALMELDANAVPLQHVCCDHRASATSEVCVPQARRRGHLPTLALRLLRGTRGVLGAVRRRDVEVDGRDGAGAREAIEHGVVPPARRSLRITTSRLQAMPRSLLLPQC
jgi:hypothetical protein